MIPDMISQIDDLIGADIGSRIYANVIPENAVFPCLRFQRVSVNPYQYKEGQNLWKAFIKIDIYAKEAVAGDSPYKIVYNLGETLQAGINALRIEDKEYRIEDVSDDYELNTDLTYVTLDLMVLYGLDVIPPKSALIMKYSYTEALTGMLDHDGEPIYVQGYNLETDPYVSESGFFARRYSSILKPSDVKRLVDYQVLSEYDQGGGQIVHDNINAFINGSMESGGQWGDSYTINTTDNPIGSWFLWYTKNPPK